MAENFGLGVMLYSPLAGGLLTGKYRENEKGRFTLKSDNKPNENDIAINVNNYLMMVANEMGIKPLTVAMLWNASKNGLDGD